MALVLVALGAGALAASAATTGSALAAARRDAAATASALAILDELRAGPRTSGADGVTIGDGTALARAWRARSGRGWPDPLDVHVTWGTHTIALATEALP